MYVNLFMNLFIHLVIQVYIYLFIKLSIFFPPGVKGCMCIYINLFIYFSKYIYQSIY